MRCVTLLFAVFQMLFCGGVGLMTAIDDDVRYIGSCSMADVLSFDQRYAQSAFIYRPDAEAVAVLEAVDKPLTIKVFFRTDCADSVREVPRFIKAVKEADNDLIVTEFIGMNVAKNQPADLIEGWDIRRVPTFVVVSDGSELGRVVEHAEQSVEKDIARIINNR